ncbi:Regulation of nuclear pre-mRNA domain-containing protein 1A [Schistosoma japonicum]|nr:Regulation of nuclear pre-mRNA domain-containing protein 1A [Schistosoma japonicum]KAH8873496.1 Regulation of nuclear pre-mRNA domain-containing protein 1A [Schistosoma japonicum]KAH8873498.1 Regulation of nuclear pre-mRNA domain-containing protein 1A [Schistosoma japonicum]
MSYTETEAVKKLQDLDNSQVSVESTSQWFLSNKQMAKDLVKLWFKEFRKTSPKKKIAFLHLANDVIQRGITIAPQFRKLFEPVLPTAFKETSKFPSVNVVLFAYSIS